MYKVYCDKWIKSATLYLSLIFCLFTAEAILRHENLHNQSIFKTNKLTIPIFLNSYTTSYVLKEQKISREPTVLNKLRLLNIFSLIL